MFIFFGPKNLNSDLTLSTNKRPGKVCSFAGPEGFWQDPPEGATACVPGRGIVSWAPARRSRVSWNSPSPLWPKGRGCDQYPLWRGGKLAPLPVLTHLFLQSKEERGGSSQPWSPSGSMKVGIGWVTFYLQGEFQDLQNRYKNYILRQIHSDCSDALNA